MRKYLFLLMAALVLVACGNEESSKEDNKSKENEEVTANNESNSKDNESETNDETNNNDGILSNVGDVYKDKELGATVELVATKKVDETIDLDPIKLHIKDIKIINMSNIKSRDTKEVIKQFTDKEEFDYIQITYEMENTVDDNVYFDFPIEHVVLNTGEQIDVMMNDFIIDHNNGGDFYGKVTKNSLVSVIMNSTIPKDIESIKLITGEVWDEEYNSLSDKVEVEYSID